MQHHYDIFDNCVKDSRVDRCLQDAANIQRLWKTLQAQGAYPAALIHRIQNVLCKQSTAVVIAD